MRNLQLILLYRFVAKAVPEKAQISQGLTPKQRLGPNLRPNRYQVPAWLSPASGGARQSVHNHGNRHKKGRPQAALSHPIARSNRARLTLPPATGPAPTL